LYGILEFSAIYLLDTVSEDVKGQKSVRFIGIFDDILLNPFTALTVICFNAMKISNC